MELDVPGNSLRKYPIPAPVREEIVANLWETSGEPNYDASQHDMSFYFECYSKRVQRFLLDGGRHICIKTHSDLVRIAKQILSGRARDDVYQDIASHATSNDISCNADAIDNTIDLCASVLLMNEIGQSQIGLSGRTPIHWGASLLKTALAEHFTPQRTLDVDNLKFEKLFTGRNLSRVGGLQIIWTTNLADHLRLIDDSQTVFIFHCTSFLHLQARLKNSPFPGDFIKETLQTLALLFPSTDKATKSWLQAQRKHDNIDPTLGRCGVVRAHDRRFERFSFWHDRLVILKQAFDESQPKTLSQWWFDRRNRVQWYTFWVAVLVFVMTMVFGIIQSLEGALQVYLSYKSLQQG